MTIGTGSWTSVSGAGTTPSAADLTGTLRAVVVGTNSTVKISTTTGLTQPMGYTNWTTGASEIAFTGSLTDINTALATLSVKGAATGAGSIGVYVAPNSCGAYNPATDHYYQKLTPSTTGWAAARTYVQGQSCNGLGGYLASLDSAAEQSFTTGKVSTEGALGGSRFSGSWKWYDGPAGVSGAGVTYSGWCVGEPNGNGNTMYLSSSRGGCWDDDVDWASYNTSLAIPLIVEYGGILGQSPTQQASGTISLAVDGTPPTASWSTVPSTPSNANPLSYTLTFSEPISGL
ncbi:MAG: C-type lectin domain-containing protein, partial [Acidobacteria bacterium]|nr:C-type lectin domain-containing protein [Acidobacteriota bacterium]